MYIMCVCLFSALSRRVGALQISIIIIIIIIIIKRKQPAMQLQKTLHKSTQKVHHAAFILRCQNQALVIGRGRVGECARQTEGQIQTGRLRQ